MSFIISGIGFERYKNIQKELVNINEKIISDKIIENKKELLNKEIIDFDELRNQLKEGLSSDGEVAIDLEPIEWKIGMYPDEEEAVRQAVQEGLKESFISGIEVKEINESRKRRKEANLKTIDKCLIVPKQYIISEYGGKCQICHEEINLVNGQKYIETFHIREAKDDGWWTDRKYNVLGLCPNCFAKAKYGGRDFTNIEKFSLELINGDIFPEEIKAFNGDYYSVPIRLNGKDENIVISKDHMNNFAAFFENER